MKPSRLDVVAIALVLFAALAKIPTLAQPLTENFAWRQTQTAWTARIYHEQGIDLLHPEVPVHGPPWVFGYEFPLFQALGSLVMDLGLEPDIAMRTLGLATFLLTGALVYLLIRRLVDQVAAIAGVAAFLFSPFGLLWGRTSLIEYLATAASVGFLLAAMRWLDHRRPADFGVALLTGSLAMLVKITTGAFYLLPLLAYRRHGALMGVREWSVPALLVAPTLLGIAWVRWMDGLKAATPATEFQTSSRLVIHNFGTPAMRFDLDMLLPIMSALVIGLSGAGLVLWLPAAVARVRGLRQGPFLSLLLVSAIILPPLVLTPLYGTQNYYPAAMSPAVAVLVGVGASWAWRHRRSLSGALVLVAGTLLWALALVLTRDYWMIAYEPIVDRDGSLAAAAFIRERTGQDDWVVIEGRGWDPTILYYADRRGYMLDPHREAVDDLERLRADDRYALFVTCPYEAECRLMGDDP